MIIRVATISDATKVAELHIESIRNTYRGILPDEFLDNQVFQDRFSFWQTELASKSDMQRVFIAEEEGKCLGFICVRLNADPRWGTTIDNVHVLPNEKGKGIGTQLMEDATNWILSQAPNSGVWLWSYEQNLNTCHYYEGLRGHNAESHMKKIRDKYDVMCIRYTWESPDQLLGFIAEKKSTLSKLMR
ncbi:MAG: GNAT family N-acetyltransferase [Proteobacteria bacterium]|nr:GNAT family N-acetyltransferase [Pseudomonadota bacterium]